MSALFGELGARAGERLVDGFREELEPASKVLLLERRPPIELRVYEQRITAMSSVGGGTEERALPEITDHRKMMLEVEFRDVGKKMADERVG
jgi:hypothetical protein